PNKSLTVLLYSLRFSRCAVTRPALGPIVPFPPAEAEAAEATLPVNCDLIQVMTASVAARSGLGISGGGISPAPSFRRMRVKTCWPLMIESAVLYDSRSSLAVLRSEL